MEGYAGAHVYGVYDNVIPGHITLAESIRVLLDGYADDYDLDAIETDYRAAINKALPAGVTLAGELFIGDEAPATISEDDLRAAVASVDLGEIAARHDRTA